MAGIAAAVALIAVFAVGYERQRDYHADRYARAGDDPVITYLSQRTPEGHRVAITGVTAVGGAAPMWPASARAWRTTSSSSARRRRPAARVRRPRRPGPRAIERGRYDLIVVGRGGYARECPLPGSESDDDAWARAAGLPPLAGRDRLTLYQVR